MGELAIGSESDGCGIDVELDAPLEAPIVHDLGDGVFAEQCSSGYGEYSTITYPDDHPENGGEEVFFEWGRLMKRKFSKSHPRHGEIDFFGKGREHLRTEYAAGHPKHGEISFFQGGKHVRTEFAPGHSKHGHIHTIRDGKHVYTHFETWHPWNGRHFTGFPVNRPPRSASKPPPPSQQPHRLTDELERNDESVRCRLAAHEPSLGPPLNLPQLHKAAAALRQCEAEMAGTISAAVRTELRVAISKFEEAIKIGEAAQAKERRSAAKAAADENARAKAVSACEKATADLVRLGSVALQNWEKGDAKKAISVAGNALKADNVLNVLARAPFDPEVCQKRDEVCRLHAALETQRAAWQKADQKAKADAKTNRAAARKAAMPQHSMSVAMAVATPVDEGDADGLTMAEVYVGAELDTVLGL